jgi:hypothetical protein
MPYGLSFGRMHSEDAAKTLRGALQGELRLEYLRGRSSLDPIAQAAEVLLRGASGRRQLDGMQLSRLEEMPGERWAVEFRIGGQHEEVIVRRHISDTKIQVSCVGSKMEPIIDYELLEHKTA